VDGRHDRFGVDPRLVQQFSRTSRAGPVTLSGPGGVGKTRLAVAVAERVWDGFTEGASASARPRPPPTTRRPASAAGVAEILDIRAGESLDVLGTRARSGAASPGS